MPNKQLLWKFENKSAEVRGMLEWIKKTLVIEKMIDEKDLNLFFLADDAEHAVNHINEFYARYLLKPNF